MLTSMGVQLGHLAQENTSREIFLSLVTCFHFDTVFEIIMLWPDSFAYSMEVSHFDWPFFSSDQSM